MTMEVPGFSLSFRARSLTRLENFIWFQFSRNAQIGFERLHGKPNFSFFFCFFFWGKISKEDHKQRGTLGWVWSFQNFIHFLPFPSGILLLSKPSRTSKYFAELLQSTVFQAPPQHFLNLNFPSVRKRIYLFLLNLSTINALFKGSQSPIDCIKQWAGNKNKAIQEIQK